MQVTTKASGQEIATSVNKDNADSSVEKGKTEKGDISFQFQDSAEISERGYVMQQAQSDTKVITLPRDPENGAAGYPNPKVAVASQQDSSALKEGKSDAIRLNQIAAKIMQGQKVSSAMEKELKDSNPQLYARAQAKAKLASAESV